MGIRRVSAFCSVFWAASVLLLSSPLLAAGTDLQASDAYAGPSKPKPQLASRTSLKIGNEYKLTVKPAAQNNMRLGSVFQIETLVQDTWLIIEAKSDQAGYEWGICDLRGRYIVTKLTAGSGTQKVLLKAKALYALYFEFVGARDAPATYTVKLSR